jgi:hypothetical protein
VTFGFMHYVDPFACTRPYSELDLLSILFSCTRIQLSRSRARGVKDAQAAAEAEAGAALIVGQPSEGVANAGADGELADEAIAQKLMFEAEPVKPASP